jgi:hypothetical protein
MKRRVQPLMARDTLGFEYTGDDDTSWMPGGEVDNDDIVDRLTRIFKQGRSQDRRIAGANQINQEVNTKTYA